MWKRLQNRDGAKYQLIDGETYKVRMVCTIDENDNDVYAEFVCVWRQGLKIFIVKDNFDVYEWIDMDDVWEESE